MLPPNAPGSAPAKLATVFAALALLFAAATPALAAPKAKRAKKPDPALEQAKVLLGSKQRDQVEAGIQNLGLIGTPEIVEPLSARIRQGLPPELLETAIVTLMTLGQPSSGPVLFELAAHRRPEVRLRAIEAIAAVAPPGAEAVLVAALSDENDQVRSAAATGLGDLGARGSFEILFHALDRGNLNASPAIGKVIAPDQATRLLTYLGRIPFYSLGPALSEVVRRPDVPEDAKLAIISSLGETGTPEVKGFLGDLLAAGGEALGQKVTRALLRAMQEIAD